MSGLIVDVCGSVSVLTVGEDWVFYIKKGLLHVGPSGHEALWCFRHLRFF